MKRLVVKSWLLLLYFEFIMRSRNFKRLHAIVRDQKIHPMAPGVAPSSAELCRAVDLACVFYFKQVMCLQRSAVTALLLRRHGWDAKMVVGAQVLPFKSHAWVEIKGTVVNDKPYMLDMYQVLERC
jgi:Transglutaminase-like superfamily